MENIGFVSACAKFFGRLPGQSLADFSAELKKLTPGDKRDFIKWFPSVGYTVTDAEKYADTPAS